MTRYRRLQRQDSLDDQLRDVAQKAVEMGCYDAADWIARQLRQRRLITPKMREDALEFMRSHRDA